MNFEWDENKRLSNIAKHGIDFIKASTVWDNFYVTQLLPYPLEKRFMAIGILDDVVVALIYTLRNSVIRIISVRKARENEKKDYNALYQRAVGKNDR